LGTVFNKPVFENAGFHVLATNSASPVVSVSVLLSLLLLFVYCYICSLANSSCLTASDSIFYRFPLFTLHTLL